MCLSRALLRFNYLNDELETFKKTNKHHHLTVDNILYRKKLGKSVDEYEKNLSYANEKDNMNSSINNYKPRQTNSINEYKQLKRRQSRKLNDIKLAFSEFYLMLIFLKNYQTLNFMGFSNILKQYDRLFETARGHQWQ